MSKALGQYFTTSPTLLHIVKSLIKNTDGLCLEPSFGRGDLIKLLNNREIHGYEIDKNIKRVFSITLKHKIYYADFLTVNIQSKYQTIIGNPPYVKASTNLYLQFINKCVQLLDYGGELIFIVPSDFMRASHSANIINTMFSNGKFTHVYLPMQENLFTNAKIDVMVFRYVKSLLNANPTQDAMCLVNDIPKPIRNNSGMISFQPATGLKIKDLFDVHVGIVSGCDAVFQHDTLGNIDVLTDFNQTKKYILINEYPSEPTNNLHNTQIDEWLLLHKQRLLQRKIRKFNETNWFEWGALRNINTQRSKLNTDCIYVRCITRKSTIASVGKVQLFSGGLLCLIPKETIALDEICKKINQCISDYMYSGRFKITHKQLSHLDI
jgi:adenine-specific DNA-methyltransferase